jgi:hypothetical protein
LRIAAIVIRHDVPALQAGGDVTALVAFSTLRALEQP